ncbi:MAG: lytic murein transglycosylase [Patescibacteria group bacterium]
MRRFLAVFLFFLVFSSPFLTIQVGAQVAGQINVEQRRKELEAELARVEAEILVQTAKLGVTQKEGASLERDLKIIEYELNQSRLKIKAKKLEIEQLGGDIVKKEGKIGDLKTRISRQQVSLAELLRQVRDSENLSLVEILLDEPTVSGVFSNVDSFVSVQDALHRSFDALRTDKVETETEKASLEKKRAAELDAKKVIEAEEAKIKANEAEKRRLLGLNKTEQTNYKQVIAARERRKIEIRSALFQLRGSTAISFGQALEYATVVSRATGVRPAFIMAILTQESNLGQNVGTCNRPGDPPAKQWRAIMKPERDLQPFIKITSELGISPEGLPLSCPMAGGWGGAMGPSQFIPSTWMIYKDRIAVATGNRPPNPWLPQDAFAATGIYVADLGADAGGFTAERTAALKYYAGGNWSKPSNAFYGDSVMRITTNYQTLIDTLTAK